MLRALRDTGVVARYYLYRAVAGPGFIWPIYVLYLRAHGLSFAAIGAIGAVQTAIVLSSEIPTGYVGDRIGRRDSLAVAQVVFAGSAVGMILADGFLAFTASFALLSFAMTFVSGSSDAWLYDVLEERLDEDDFTHVKGRGAAIGQWVTAGTMIVGSLMYVAAPVAPFVALLGSRLLTLLVVLTMPKTARYAADTDPADDASTTSEGGDDDTITAADTLPIIRDRLMTPPLRPFVAYVALFVATAMTAGIFIQPITIEALEGPVGRALAENGVPEPATLGLLYAAFTGVAALASDRASDLEDWLGVRRALLVVPVAIAVLLVLPVAVPLLAFPMFFGLKAGQSIVRPIVGQYLNDHLASVGRATVLSAVSMVYAVLRIPYSLGAGTLADVTSPLTTVAVLGGVFVVVGGALFALGGPVRTRSDAPVTESPAD